MSKITKVTNGEYIGANKYTIKDAGDGKSTVDFAPDSILTPGTAVGAEILNEIQMNGVYTLDTDRVVEGQKEVYVVNLEGFTEFNNPDLNLVLRINSNNISDNVYLRLNNIDYEILNCGIGNLISGRFVNAKKEGNFIKLLSFEKTDLAENDTNKVFSAKGAFDLKTWLANETGKKVSKAGDTMTGVLEIISPDGLRIFPDSNDGFIQIKSIGGIPALRYGGTGTLADAGFVVAGTGDNIKFKVNNSGECYVRGNSRLYHEDFKPTKADVGLSNVNDWSATSSVSNPSNTIYATAGAVKQAYDKGVDALNKANTAQSTANSKVSKAGDIMTGSLRVRHNDGVLVEHTNGDAVALDVSLDRARIRCSGIGQIANRGFTIEGPGDAIKFKVADDGECYVRGNSRIYHEGFKPTPSATRLFNGASLFGQKDWKDSGILINRQYFFVYFRVSAHGTDAKAFATSVIPTSVLRAIDGVPIYPESSAPKDGDSERFRVKILNDKLYTLSSGEKSIDDNYILEVWGVEL